MPRNRQKTASRIQQAAIRLLQRDGFAGWGINAVAREADVDKVLIYRYFESLEGLLTEIIRETRFWPDPETLDDSGPDKFISDTIRFQEANALAAMLISLPKSSQVHATASEGYSHDLEHWLDGFRDRCDGYISASQLYSLPARIHFQCTHNSAQLSATELWQQVSPPLEWKSGESFQGLEELPIELL